MGEYPARGFTLLGDDCLWFEGEVTPYARLSSRCHPTRKERPPTWWFTHPTFGMWGDIEQPEDPTVIGYASFSLGPGAAWFWDLCVHPFWQKKGLGRVLFAQRILICEMFGVKFMTGMCAPDNAPMVKIFEEAEFVRGDLIEGAYLEEDPVRDGIPWGGVDPSFAWARTVAPWKRPDA